MVGGAVLAALSACSSSGGSSGGGDAKVHNITYYGGSPATDPNTIAQTTLANMVKSESNGTLIIKPQNLALGTIAGVAQETKTGQVQMWQGDPAGLAQIDPEMDLLALPFVINSPADVSRVFGPNGVGTQITDSLDKYGLKLLSFQELGWINLDTKTPVKNLTDLRGLKVRAQPDQIQPVLFSSVGAQPASLDITEVFTALQTNTISGFGDPLAVIEGGKYNTVAPNITIANVIYNPCLVVVNKAFFQSLTPDQQKILQSAATKVAQQEVAKDRAAQTAALAAMKQQGAHVYTMSAADLATWKKDLAPLYQTYESKYGSLATKLINGS